MARNKNTEYVKHALYAQQPQSINNYSQAYLYYRGKLIRNVMNIFRLENTPPEWNLDYMWRNLLLGQPVAIADTPLGVLPLICTPSGTNVFGFPTKVAIPNHMFPQTPERTLGENAVLLYLDYMYDIRWFYNVNALLDKYSALLANCDSAINVNLINSKVAYIFDCADDTQALDAKAIYDTISRGEPAVFKRSNAIALNDEGTVSMTLLNVKNNYIADMVQDTKRSIMSEFWTELGVKNSPVDKKERVNTREVESNDMQLMCSVYDWYRNLTKQFRRANELFGLNLEFSMPFYDMLEKGLEISVEGGENNADTKSTDNDAV